MTGDAPWASTEARRIAVAACYDCHSNQTDWSWYSHVAPASWLVTNDVDEGRDALNFSAWDRRQDADDLVESVADGSMPPRSYLLAPSLGEAVRRREGVVAFGPARARDPAG